MTGFSIAQYIGLLLISATVGNAQWSNLRDPCTTPDRQNGDCKSIKECKPVLDMLLSAPRPIPPAIKDRLQQYNCGYSGSTPKVCCPTKPIETGPPDPPDVSSHQKLRLLPTNCGVISTDDRIIGGNVTSLFEFPWMALLSYQTGTGPDFKCGGTVINDRYILTAAHCIKDTRYPLIGVRVGEHDLRTTKDCEKHDSGVICAPPVQNLKVEQVIVHPKYDLASKVADIGLIRVSRMEFKKNVRPVCLPLEEARTYNFTNRNVIVTGWGATETNRNSPILLKVEVPVIDEEVCGNTYKSQVVINYKQLCAGGRNNRDSCGGDSGGPLHVAWIQHDDTRYIQQGIVSFGPRYCGIEGYPGVYTRVAYYMDWILNNISA